MLIILSPSKSQDFTSEASIDIGYKPKLLRHSQYVVNALREYSVSDIKKLMKISDKLAESTYVRTQKWNKSFATQKRDTEGELNFKQALFAYTGDVYRAFEDKKFTKGDYVYVEKNIRILSGLYGITTPLTYIKPYRLEMGTKMPIAIGKKKYKNLYEYWREILAICIEKEFKKNEPIINLASNEYSKALDLKRYGDHVYNIDFKVKKDGKFKIIGIFAKRQRGEMAYWLMKNSVENADDIKAYTNDAFVFNKEQSTSRNLVFTR